MVTGKSGDFSKLQVDLLREQGSGTSPTSSNERLPK